MIDLRHSTAPEVVLAASVVGELKRAMDPFGAEFVVIGATARNLLAVGIVGELPRRATRDLDVAIAVEDWSHYDAIARTLRRSGSVPHRFDVGGMPVDIVPYGSLETPDRTVRWPDDMVLGVMGLAEVVADAQLCVLPGGVATRVPTVAGLAALKLLAFTDRRLETRRDAVDLSTILGWLDQGDSLDELYRHYVHILERYGFDPALAAAHRLGADMRIAVGESVAREMSGRLGETAVAELAAAIALPGSDGLATVDALVEGLTHAPPGP